MKRQKITDVARSGKKKNCPPPPHEENHSYTPVAISLRNLNVQVNVTGNNVTRKYWLIADRPNEAKKCGPFSPLVQILWGGGGGGGAWPPAPLFLHP